MTIKELRELLLEQYKKFSAREAHHINFWIIKDLPKIGVSEIDVYGLMEFENSFFDRLTGTEEKAV